MLVILAISTDTPYERIRVGHKTIMVIGWIHDRFIAANHYRVVWLNLYGKEKTLDNLLCIIKQLHVLASPGLARSYMITRIRIDWSNYFSLWTPQSTLQHRQNKLN